MADVRLQEFVAAFELFVLILHYFDTVYDLHEACL